MAAPQLLDRSGTGHLIIAVLALTADDQQTAETHAQAAADNAIPHDPFHGSERYRSNHGL